MAEPLYTVTFDGSLRRGCEPDDVKAKLTAALKLRPDHIDKLFSGQPITVKRNLPYAHALRLQAIFEKAGALCRLLSEQAKESPPVSPDVVRAPDGSPATDGGVAVESHHQSDLRAPEPPVHDTRSPSFGSPQAVPSRTQPTPSAAENAGSGWQETATGSTSSAVDADSWMAGGADPMSVSTISDDTSGTAARSAPGSTDDGLHLSPSEIPGLFAGRLQRIPPSAAYRAGLIGVAIATLLMPLIYGLLVLGVGYAVLWYAFNGLLLVEHKTLAAMWFGYLLPIAVGAVVFVFLLKPVFAKRLVPMQRLELDPLREPVLFALVHHIAELVGAPHPERISVDAEINASAGLSRGLPWFGGGLELTIGMPLFAGMSTRQLVGVLGHEFGHFAQSAGMRATYVVRVVNYWFYRAIYERDAWDAKLAALGEHRVGSVAIIFVVASWAVAVQRRILAGLHWSGHLISQYMLRQMEFDADRYEAQMAGSAYFRDTTDRLLLLMHAFDDVYHDMATSWEDRKLPEDLPGMIAHRADELAPALREEIESHTNEAGTGLFASHPPDSERIARAEELQMPGLFRLDASAKVLLRKYDKLARRTTERFYRGVLGIAPSSAQLVTGETVAAAAEQSRQQDNALNDYCGDMFVPFRFMALEDWRERLSLSPEQRGERLGTLIVQLRRALPEFTHVLLAYQRLDEQVMLAYCDHVFEEASIAVDTLAADRRPLVELKTEWIETGAALDRQEAVLAERLAIGLGGLIYESGEHSEIAREIGRLVAVQDQFATLNETYNAVYAEVNALARLYALHAGQATDDAQGPVVPDTLLMTRLRSVVELLGHIKAVLEKVAYPFSRAGGEVSVFAHLTGDLPQLHPTQIESVLDYSRELFDALPRLHRRVFGRIAHLAYGYERGMGVAPLNLLAGDAHGATSVGLPRNA